MMDQPTFRLVDDEDVLTPEQAHAWLCKTVSDPELAQRFWDDLGQVDPGLQALMMKLHPELRERFWDTLTDELKFWCVVCDPGEVADTAALVKRVVGDLVSTCYRLPWQE